MTGHKPRRGIDERWVYPTLVGARAWVGLQEV